MRVFGIWRAGDDHGLYEMSTHGETWVSMSEAKRVLRDRFENGYWQRDTVTRVVDIDEAGYAVPGAVVDSLHPAVSGECQIELFTGVRSGEGGRGRRWLIDDEPFARLTLGPRGGVVVERY